MLKQCILTGSKLKIKRCRPKGEQEKNSAVGVLSQNRGKPENLTKGLRCHETRNVIPMYFASFSHK